MLVARRTISVEKIKVMGDNQIASIPTNAGLFLAPSMPFASDLMLLVGAEFLLESQDDMILDGVFVLNDNDPRHVGGMQSYEKFTSHTGLHILNDNYLLLEDECPHEVIEEISYTDNLL
jgi:hypothetical protein